MESIYNFDALKQLLNSFYLITGRKITLKSEGFGDVITSSNACGFCRQIQSTTFGYQKCIACDSKALTHARQENKAYLYRCHAGLMEVAVPVMEKGELIAYLMYGQVLDESSMQEQWARIEKQCAWHSDIPSLKREFMKLDCLPQKKLRAYADILSACAAYIWLNKYVQQSEQTDAQRLKTYIDENYARRLTLNGVAADLRIGKTKLCELARQEHGCSVQQLIRQKRIRVATRLLESTNLSVGQISESVGFIDCNYFVKIFKADTGSTPLHYRKQYIKGQEAR